MAAKELPTWYQNSWGFVWMIRLSGEFFGNI